MLFSAIIATIFISFITGNTLSISNDEYPSFGNSSFSDDNQVEDVLISTAVPIMKPSTLNPTKLASSISPSKYPSRLQSSSPSPKITVVPSSKVVSTRAPSTLPSKFSTTIPSTTTYVLSDLLAVEIFQVKSSKGNTDDGGAGGSHAKARPTFSPIPSVRPTTARPTTTGNPLYSKSFLRTSSPSVNPSFRSTVAPSSKPVANPTKSPGEDISYHGGLIMTGTVNAYNIYYGNISSSTKNLMDYFAANLGNSSWYSTVTPYYQIVNGVKTYASKSLVFKKSVDVAATKTVLSMDDVINILLALFTTGKLSPDSNGVYTLFFRGDITVTAVSFSGALPYWLVDFCGYHGAFRLAYGSTIIKFMVIGDPSYAGANGEQCEQIRFSDPGGTANNNLGADSMVSVYANEIANTITDYNGGWYFNSNGLEVADVCFWDFGDYSGNSNMVAGTKRFLVQQMWVPTKGCVMSL
mmetsp:Transcript_22921/g.32927  ORF Transcript_22921/g.32927 Transcript_22921/m.32927 type:complete len:466 (+) Transcript_22921:91-1488(+)